MKEIIKKYLLRRTKDYNFDNKQILEDLSIIAYDFGCSINDTTIKKILKEYNRQNNFTKKNKTTIEYWLYHGHDGENSKLYAEKYRKEKKRKTKLKNGFDISDFNLFINVSKCVHCMQNYNYANTYLLKKYYTDLEIKNITSNNQLNLKLLEVINKYRNGKRGTPSSVSYWVSLGWDEETANIKVSEFQKSASMWSVDMWINKGFDINSANTKISEIQKSNVIKNLNKYTKEDRQNRSHFHINYWLNKGYNIKEAKLQLRKINPMCIEFHNYDYVSFYKMKDIISKKQIINWQNGIYNTVGFINSRRQSKEEIAFFEFIKNIVGMKHKPFNVSIKDIKTNIIHRAIYDGYIKIDNMIILIEYDGKYWHNEDKDNIRDSKTLKLRKDITGIIRIECKYFKQNKEKIIKQIYESIKKIKNNEKNRIKLYTGCV